MWDTIKKIVLAIYYLIAFGVCILILSVGSIVGFIVTCIIVAGVLSYALADNTVNSNKH